MNKLLLSVLLLIPLALFAQTTTSVQPAKTIKGTGSFYATRFNGRPTATGETFTHSKLTAASNNFKFHSWVRVTNLSNNKCVIVRINDRMAAKSASKGRVVDLTRAAAEKLGVGIGGLIKVLVEAVPSAEL